MAEVLDAAVRVADHLRALAESLVSTDSSAEELRAADAFVRQALAAVETGTWRHHDVPAALDDELTTGLRAHGPVAGVAHPFAPPVTMRWTGQRVVGSCRLGRLHEGPRGYAHGGVSAMLMDEVCAKVPGLMAANRVTRSLAVRYRRPVPLFCELELAAELVDRDGADATVRGTIATAAEPDVALVVAEGTFLVFEPGSTGHAIGDSRG